MDAPATTIAPGRSEALRIVGLVHRPLVAGFPAVAHQLTSEILRQDAAYAELVPPAELRARVQHNLCQALAALIDRAQGLSVDLADATVTGRRRAEQGLPLASLLHAYRRGGRLMWLRVTELVRADHPEALPELLPLAADLWDVLDQIGDAVTESYRSAAAARAARAQDRRNALLDSLLDGSGVATGSIPEAVSRLGLPERGRYAVAVLRPLPGAFHQPRTGQGQPGGEAADGPRFLWRIHADREVALVQLRGHEPAEIGRQLGSQPVRVGVSPAVGSLADLGRARWLAETALQTCTADGPELAHLDDRLPAALLVAQPELAQRLTRLLAPVLALPHAERHSLLDTLGAWLESGGSATTAADRLYCHRNTVLNRIRRLEQLTGRRLAEPTHVVELALALTAFRTGAGLPPATG
ncbi:helix-turn-helix domain-containing protein [Kitasatospora sp. NPDC002040]|uniref:PucR family transcriptional regulator n=1 Tax=Kitasatospora sp. NPDC002040 TaxID=3154661 RepID=UPI0033332236